jgi:hypothetical protein
MTDDVGSNYGAQSSKVFQSQEDLFIVKDGKMVLLKTKTKDMQVIFGDDFEKANAIIKDQKLNLKNQEDVRVLIRQLN